MKCWTKRFPKAALEDWAVALGDGKIPGILSALYSRAIARVTLSHIPLHVVLHPASDGDFEASMLGKQASRGS